MADAAIREFLSGVDSGAGGGAPVTRITGAGTAVGDLLVVAHGVDFYDATMPAPTGTAGSWTQQFFADGGANQPQLKIWTRPVTVAGPQTVTVANQADAANFLALWVISGTDLTVVDADGQTPAIASTSMVLPSMTLDTAPGLQLAAFLTEASGAVNHTPPAGMTEHVELDASSFSTMSAVSDTLESAGATGTRTATSSAALKYGVAGIIVRAGATAGNEGTLTATAPVPTVSLTGTVHVGGELAATAPVPTVSLTAITTVPGELAATAPAPTASLTGTVTVTGTVAVVAPLPVVTLTEGAAAAGPVHVTAPLPVASFTATVTVTGQLAAVAPLPTASIAVTGPVPGLLHLDPQLPIPGPSGQIRRASARWRILLADTRTGQILGELPYQALSWSDTVDFTRTSALTVTAPLETVADVARIRSVARGSWRYTLLALYDGRPIVGGPVLTHKIDPEVTSAELGCGGPASLFAARLITRVNLMPNGSFEQGITGWDVIGPGGSTKTQITQSVPPTEPAPPDGDSWLRVISGGTTGALAFLSPRVPVTPGLIYAVSASVKNSLAAQQLDAFLLWYPDASSTWTSFTHAPWGDVFGAWAPRSMIATAPPGAAYVGIQAQAPSVSAGHYLDVDAVLVEHSSAVNPFDLTRGEVQAGPTSLPEIARLMMLLATLKAGSSPGAELPITLPDDVDPNGSHVRTYQMHELATIAERLGQLTQVEGGPDLHLRPVLSADGRHFTWQARIGRPRLGQAGAGWMWTYGANCSAIGVDSDATAMTMRAYVPGQADTDAGPPVGEAEDLSLLDAGWPLLERADAARSTTETTVNLDAQAADFLRAHDRPVEAWQVTARADAEPPLGVWQLGDDAVLRVRGHRWIEDGDYPRRLLAVSGDAGDEITLGVTSGEGQV